MAITEIDWYKIAANEAEINWQGNNMCVITIQGKTVTLARFNDHFYAFAHKCPHASGIMADGFIDALGNVVCPLHRYKFSMQNGRNISGEGFYLKTYLLEEKEDGIYVGLPKSKFLFF
jgi:nitrite reductase/ring-hydroxylating ferredoxin subunit